MTSQPVPQTGKTHLTAEQFDELLACSTEAASPSASAAEAHLLACPQCTAELAGLRDSLTLFRLASTAHAENELSRRPLATLPARRPALAPAMVSAYWAAAATLVLAAFLPMQTLRQRPLQPAHAATTAVADSPAQSDEALLEDIDREASATVPTPMQALVDPTGTSSSTQTSTQRKD